MVAQTFQMGLFDWNDPDDQYSYQLSQNWQKINFHDHTPGRGIQLTANAFADHAITGQKLALGSIEGDNIDPSTTITISTLDASNISSDAITVAGEGIFIQGIQSGNSENEYGVTSYGGFTAASGGIDITNGSLLITAGSVILDAGAIQAENSLYQSLFIGGIQSGNLSHENGVISYGGFTAVYEGVTIQNTGGISINNGNINVTTGSITLSSGTIVTSGGASVFNGGIQSGNSSAANQVISYGGFTAENNYGFVGTGASYVTLYSGQIYTGNGNIWTGVGNIAAVNDYPQIALIDLGHSNNGIYLAQQNGVGYITADGTYPNSTGTEPPSNSIAMQWSTQYSGLMTQLPNGSIHGYGSFNTYREGVTAPSAYFAGDLIIGGALVFAGALNTSSEYLQIWGGNDGTHSAILTNAGAFSLASNGVQGGTYYKYSSGTISWSDI